MIENSIGNLSFELKNVKVHDDMSEETVCFSATLYVDGKKTAVCRNNGHGGMTDVRFLSGTDDTALRFMQYCKTNPIVNHYNGKEYKFYGVDTRVDEMLIEYQMKKDLKRKEKNQLVLHQNSKNDPPYIIHSYIRLGENVTDMVRKYPVMLKTTIEKYMKMGFVIMNTNINMRKLGIELEKKL